MSRFYGSLTGQAKSTATRRGGVKSGIVAHVRGWDVGMKVFISECECGGDFVEGWRTGGSNDTHVQNRIFSFCSTCKR